ncbi:MAG: hypothetical protein IKX88_07725 [Thermoguttaceae bacterium]|nr:hypothetical protein [Thermoguttaceae bacterium]
MTKDASLRTGSECSFFPFKGGAFPKRNAFFKATLGALFLLFLFFCLWNGRQRYVRMKDVERRATSMSSVCLGLMNACETYGQTIAPNVLDENGEKILSWRAVIVPFLFCPNPCPDMNQAWNSPQNMTVFSTYSQCYGPMDVYCYENKDYDSIMDETTNVFAFTGKDSFFDSERPTSYQSAPPDMIVLIELGASKTFWAAPCDFEDICKLYNDDKGINEILGVDNKGFLVAFCDGSVWYLKKDAPIETIKRLSTVTGVSQTTREQELRGYVLKKFR